ncbi:hypothetical protein BZL30_0627 [Mycobacterium kansasii]|uniref:Uncharacterized protein n=1 Tax=Mycobacterium kansasii TaxID=1768 RepID=A0A1V3XUA6_MYCKA|nr:hypothetical protein BZL30_0627 [Mycobacterium kansasii]
MLAATGCAVEQIARSGVAVQTKQPEDGTGAAADDVKLIVRRDQVVGEQRRRNLRIGEQPIVSQAR